MVLLLLLALQEVEVYIEPYDYVDEVVLSELDKATISVSLAYYNISLPSIREKLVELKAKGVKIKILMDARVAYDKDWDEQTEALSLPVRRVPNLRGKTASMHKKFVLIDGKTVIAGSGNLSSTGTQSNHENAVLIRSPQVAALYQKEVEETEGIATYMDSVFTSQEMETFIAKGEYPVWWPSAKKEILKVIWKKDKPTGPQTSWLRTYFSPEDKCHQVILNELDQAKTEVWVVVFSLTRKDLAQKLAQLKGQGVRVEVVTDKNQADGDTMKEVNQILASAGIPHIKARNWNAFYAAMHHKYCVIDGKTVITGSYNWTYSATSQNDENLHVIQSPAIAKRFSREFVSLLARYDPTFKAIHYDWNVYHDSKPEVAFVCRREDTQPGDTVCVVGNVPELGSWDPMKAVPLRTGSSTFPSWIGSARFAAGIGIEFKFLLKRSSGSVEWETGGNRVWTVPYEGHSFHYDAEFGK